MEGTAESSSEDPRNTRLNKHVTVACDSCRRKRRKVGCYHPFVWNSAYTPSSVMAGFLVPPVAKLGSLASLATPIAGGNGTPTMVVRHLEAIGVGPSRAHPLALHLM